MTFNARRRRLLGIAAGASVLAGASRFAKGAKSAGEVPRRRLGHTGEMVSMVGLGGYHLVRPGLDEAESIRIVRAAIDRGINFLDNCWDYNGGQSEVRMGKALRDGYRQRAFLMTKIDGRDKNTAARQIDESLRRLGTDQIDLLQFHEVIRMDDPDRIFAAGGAMEAALEARKAGKIRYVGFTGHKSPIGSTSCSFTRSFGWTTRIASSRPAAPWKRRSRPGRRGRSGMSALPATRVRPSI